MIKWLLQSYHNKTQHAKHITNIQVVDIKRTLIVWEDNSKEKFYRLLYVIAALAVVEWHMNQPRIPTGWQDTEPLEKASWTGKTVYLLKVDFKITP